MNNEKKFRLKQMLWSVLWDFDDLSAIYELDSNSGKIELISQKNGRVLRKIILDKEIQHDITVEFLEKIRSEYIMARFSDMMFDQKFEEIERINAKLENVLGKLYSLEMSETENAIELLNEKIEVIKMKIQTEIKEFFNDISREISNSNESVLDYLREVEKKYMKFNVEVKDS